MNILRWKYFQRTAVCCVIIFVLWEIYYVLHLSASDGSTVMNKLINSVLSDDHKVRATPQNVNRVTSYHITTSHHRPNISNPDELKLLIDDINNEQYIRNGDRLGLHLTGESIVILVQVHNRLQELKYLIESLERARFIEKCLVIFSHDLYSVDINDVIRSILSFPVLQIYYPYSLQLYPSSFPGTSPNDCPRNIVAYRKRKCLNYEHPDSYGHYREANITQLKHHWLWHLYHVIEEVRVLKDFTGIFLRIDEDYYLSEDALQVLHEMNRLRSETRHKYKLMILGGYDDIPTWTFAGVANMIRKRYWYVGVGRGMAFDRRFWEDLKTCSNVFCTYDDYNWDWSLQETVQRCLGGILKILQPAVGRVFHVGLCRGFHRTDKDCSTKNVVQKVNNLLITNEEFLFPKTMYLTENMQIDIGFEHAVINGGWRDPRDHRLCKSFLDGKGQIRETIEAINKRPEM